MRIGCCAMRVKEKELSMKDRITIRIKNARPLNWRIYVIACGVLLALLLVMGALSGRTSAVEAPDALTDQENQLRVTVVGELKVSDEIRALANKTSYAALLQNLTEYWKGSDYVLAAAAGPVLTYDVSHYTSTRESGAESVYLRPAALRGFASAGITGLNFANDDVYNYGATGIESTIRELGKTELDYFGIAESTENSFYCLLPFDAANAAGEAQARAVAVLGVNDVIRQSSTVREDRVGIVNSSLEDLYLRVYEASQSADLTVVYIHAGEENGSAVTSDQELLAHALVDSGADIVVGAHSDRVQTMERYNGGLILYGLGELFSTAEYSILLHSAMLDLVVDGSGGVSAYVTPLRIVDGIPQIANDSYYRSQIIGELTSGLSDGDYTITEDGQICVSLGTLPADPAYQPDAADGAGSTAEDVGAEGIAEEDQG